MNLSVAVLLKRKMGRRELKDLAIATYREPGNAIEGERIIGQARAISRTVVVPGTSSHRIQEVVLKSNALCVIDRPFRLVEQAMRIKKI